MSKKTLAHAIADVPPAELEKRAAKIVEHLDAIDALMSDGVELSDAERHVALRLGGEDEAKALTGVLDFADARPAVFESLAKDDQGNDPDVFETSLLRGRLANALTLTKVAARIDETRAAITDSALYVTTLAKGPALAAYRIAKPHQQTDRELGKLLNAAVNLFRERAIAGAKARKAKADKKTG